MNILIIGGGGVIGQKLGRALAARGELRGKAIAKITLADIADPAPIANSPVPVEAMTCNIADPASVAGCVTAETDVIYLLAAIVSAHAEEDLDAGLTINMMGTLNVLQRARALGTKPVLVFTSSIESASSSSRWIAGKSRVRKSVRSP